MTPGIFPRPLDGTFGTVSRSDMAMMEKLRNLIECAADEYNDVLARTHVMQSVKYSIKPLPTDYKDNNPFLLMMTQPLFGCTIGVN